MSAALGLRKHQVHLLPLLLILINSIIGTYCYKVPPVTVEPLARGFRVSIPDESGVKSVAFNVNRNRNFTGFEQGDYSGQVHEPHNGRWQYDFVKGTLAAYDTLFLWTNVQHGTAMYRDQGKPLDACELPGNYLPRGCARVVSEIDHMTREQSSSVGSQSEPCDEGSETVLSPQSGRALCKGQLIFEENFDQLNESLWQHEVRAPLDSIDAEFVLYDGKAQVREGQLIIEPTLWSNYRPDLPITHAQLDLSERCTGTHNRQKECVLVTSGPIILPPVVAPRVTTKESFQFKYGRIEIRAQLPRGDWLIPLLLLEPYMESYGQTGYESGQLRVAMARGNDQLRLPHGKLIDGRTLFAGPVLSVEATQREDFMVQLRRSVHFGNDFHVYGLEWSSKSLRFTVDGIEFGELTNFVDSGLNPSWRRSSSPLAPFDRMFYISLGLSVGGFGDFVDRLRTATYEKPWLNKHPQAKLNFWQSQDKWFPSWKQPKLLVDYVRVYAI
ncbi:gram-negative bacteria-binding protein 1 [Drosophila sulfurigaster albostrigata]|uniref:gram-negative bacteria-binding protein 1 n=1 Tax=Drosophila sulfurigaster albostrigata TaxID=89887 RepID=UPI002D21C76A|nr:gram-negative bacteria-binding protein 1 [Drosophila sulfurigaster albostrigata]